MTDLLCCIAAIGVHLGSVHEGPQPVENLNPVNPGAYLQLRSGWVAGAYYNSVRRASVYAGYQLQAPAWGPVQAAVTLGVITGYQGRPLPALVPSVYVGLGQDGWGVRVSYIPKVQATKVHTVHFALERRF